MKITNSHRVKLITTPSSDLLVVNAARVSFHKESWYLEDGSLRTEDQKLLNYLAKHAHITPFTHARETFSFEGDYKFDVEALLHLGNPNTINSMVYAEGLLDNNFCSFVRHSLFGWIHLIKLNTELNYPFFSEEDSYTIQVLLSKKYQGSMKAYDMYVEDDVLQISVQNVDIKSANIDIGDKLSHFIDYTVCEEIPISIARQRFKHTVGHTYNEVSRRYVSDEPEIYIPLEWRMLAENKKQGSLDEPCLLHDEVNQRVLDLLAQVVDLYNEMVDKDGKYKVCPEQARMILPQAMMTSYYVTASEAAFNRVIAQRSDSHAQKEIRDLADLLVGILPK